MPEETKKEEETKPPTPEWELYLRNFLSVVPPVDPAALSTAEQGFKYVKEFAQKSADTVSVTFRSIIELMKEFTNIKGFEFKIKSLRQLEWKLHIMKQVDLPLKRDLIGIGKIEALRLSRLIHLEAGIGDGYNDVRMQIHEGLSIVTSIIFVGGKQVIPLKGAAKLIRDPKGQILVETTTHVPGTEMPVTVTFPLKQIFDEVRKSGIGF